MLSDQFVWKWCDESKLSTANVLYIECTYACVIQNTTKHWLNIHIHPIYYEFLSFDLSSMLIYSLARMCMCMCAFECAEQFAVYYGSLSMLLREVKKKSERPIILREQNSGQNEKSENHTHTNTSPILKFPYVCMHTFQIDIHINNYKNEKKIKSKVIDQVKTHTKPFVNLNWNSLRFLLLWLLLLLFIEVTQFDLLKKISTTVNDTIFCFCASMYAI